MMLMEWRVVAHACTVAGDINLYVVSDQPLIIAKKKKDQKHKILTRLNVVSTQIKYTQYRLKGPTATK